MNMLLLNCLESIALKKRPGHLSWGIARREKLKEGKIHSYGLSLLLQSEIIRNGIFSASGRFLCDEFLPEVSQNKVLANVFLHRIPGCL